MPDGASYTVSMDPSTKPGVLSKERLTELFDRLGLPPEGRRLVQRAIIEAPVRNVASSGRNVITNFHSRKMGQWIGTESRHVEFPAAVIFENDPKVLAYFAQPFTRAYEYVDPDTGEVHVVRHTPDFLVLSEDAITVVEGKPHAKLLREAEKRPYLYRQADDGTWYSPLMEQQLGELGLRFQVHSDQSFSRIQVENWLHLADYMGDAVEACPQDVVEKVRQLLQEEGRMLLHELISAPHNFSADLLLKAIADGELATNQDEEPLYEPRHAWVYRDPTYCEFIRAQRNFYQPGKPSFVIDIEPGAIFEYAGETIRVALLSEKRVVLTHASGCSTEVERDWLMRGLDGGQIVPVGGADGGALRFQDYSEAQLAEALHRQRILDGDTFGASPSARTLARYRASQAGARANGANTVLALAPQTHLRGNRTQRLDAAVVNIMKEVYAKDWRDDSAKNYKATYKILKDKLGALGLKAPSYPTFIAFIKRVTIDADVRIRKSSRYDYQQQAFVDKLDYETPVHGSRPMQYVHIDHTLLDIECISSRNGRPLGRPWLTIAVCATTRMIVAIHLTFESPSYRSVMMVVRDMVKRHGRLPEFIIVDNGSDLKSVAFATFLKSMKVNLRSRPKGAPRHGAVLERLFGRVNTEYVHNLHGNTKATKQVRMVTGKSLPKNNAEWTLELLYYGLCFWADHYYAESEHPALRETPRHAFTRLQRECGSRPQRRILFNRDFQIASCPLVDRGGTRKIHRQTGVKAFERYFWHPLFRDAAVAGTLAQVRYDPFDASSVYVFVKGQWVQARCRQLVHLPPMSEAAFEAISEEYRRKFTATTNERQELQRLSEFVKTFTPVGAAAANMQKIAEQETLAVIRGMGAITPPDLAPKTETTRASSPPPQPAPTNPTDGLGEPDDDSAPTALDWVEQAIEDLDTF